MNDDKELKKGDFTGLAKDYSQNRPDYCPSVLQALLGLLPKEVSQVDFLDVGAGTGIWTRMVYDAGVKSVTAIEPNDDMISKGIEDSKKTAINWNSGNAEKTNLPDNSVDWITMASSFHWVNFDKAIQEFYRLLRPRGRFTALWNPRFIEINPLLVKIEAYLETLRPNIKRISSGHSGITKGLSDRLWSSPYFEDVMYLEGRHIIEMSPERYLGAWRSVNDLQTQLGKKKFKTFLQFVEDSVADLDIIKASYLTRAWSARRKN